MFGRFVRWWIAELAIILMPESLRRLIRPPRQLLGMDLTGEGVNIYRQSDSETTELGEIKKADDTSRSHTESARSGIQELIHRQVAMLDPVHTEVFVAVSPDLGLVKELVLPLPAEENLAQVLSYQLERETPFRRDNVYFDYQILGKDKQLQQIKLRFYVIPRNVLDDALGLLDDWDLQPIQGMAENTDDGRLQFHFLPAMYQRQETNRVQFGLAALNLALLVMVIAVLFFRQDKILDSLQTEIEAVRTEAEQAFEVRHRIDALNADMQFLAGQELARPPVVIILEELSILLPDMSWLYQLDLKGNEVQLQGISDSVSLLVSILEASSMFNNIRFAAPVTQEQQGSGESFRLAVDIVRGSNGRHQTL